MKQPELGKRISELRKEKGWTQEELVEKCNISVRTLQRIEIGEVTPRSYTIKTILAALDYDLGTVTTEEESGSDGITSVLRKYLLLDVDSGLPVQFFKNQLTVAWIAGALYFLLGFFEAAAETFRYRENMMVFGQPVYITLKLSALISFVLFQRGFVIVGRVFDNYLLRIMSFLLIVGEILTAVYDIASVFYNPVERQSVLGTESFIYGGILIVYGISLRRLRTDVGNIARWAGLFEILAGCFFITIVLGFIGFFVLMPANLLEIIMLYKGIEIINSGALKIRSATPEPA